MPARKTRLSVRSRDPLSQRSKQMPFTDDSQQLDRPFCTASLVSPTFVASVATAYHARHVTGVAQPVQHALTMPRHICFDPLGEAPIHACSRRFRPAVSRALRTAQRELRAPQRAILGPQGKDGVHIFKQAGPAPCVRSFPRSVHNTTQSQCVAHAIRCY